MKHRIILSIIFGSISLWQAHGTYAADILQKHLMPKNDELFPEVKKINDDLYVGKVADNFYLVMERIDRKNLDDWLKYAEKQVAVAGRMKLKYLPNLDGAQHFVNVLEKYKSGNISPSNELWIAYASRDPVTKKAELKISDPAENPSIEMYVTVVTSPEALLTSHMGISRTWEVALDLQQKPPKRQKHPYQSVQLHSFAAKVMKKRDSKKVYMLTSPTVAMRDILLKKMPPHSIFVGDDLYQKELEAGEKDPKVLLTEFQLREIKGETVDERNKRLKKEADIRYEFLNIKEKIPLLKSNPPRIIRIKEERKQQFTIQTPDGKPLVTFDQYSPIYQWLFTEPYADRGLHLPYVLTDLDKLSQWGDLIKS